MTGSFHGATLARGTELNASTAIRSFPLPTAVFPQPPTNDLGGSVGGNSALANQPKVQCRGLLLARSVARFCRLSADRRHVENARLGPKRIEAAGCLQGRAVIKVTIAAFAVVPDLPDDVVDPRLVAPHSAAIMA